MTTLDRLTRWREAGIINEAQHGVLSALVRKERFSVFFELNAFLYLGVLSIAAGLGLTIQKYFTSLGDAFILATLSLILLGSLYYCFSRSPAYSSGEVESPSLIFDYVLYLGCLALSVELGYIEFRYEWLKNAWDNYLLFSSLIFFVLAYRFDNRFVLSLALSSLAGWFGLRVTRFEFNSAEPLRICGLVYGAVVALIGTFLYRQGIKKHFLAAYLHIATNVIFAAAVSGIEDRPSGPAYILLLLLLMAASIGLGIRFRRFAFVVYGTVYGYIGLSIELMRDVREPTTILAYLAVTGTIVIVSLALLARRFGRVE